MTMLESRQNAEVDQSQLCYDPEHAQSTHAGNLAMSAHAQVKPRITQPHGVDAGELLFQPGVLEALSSAVAARIATAGGDTENNALPFKFSAAKNPMRGISKRKIKRKVGQTELKMRASKC